MNDRYLFKAKRIDNGEWIVGLPMQMCGQLHIINPDDENTAYPIDVDTVCQCTGLRDKFGKLIWENDICDRKEKIPEVVKYHEGDWTLDYSYASRNECGFNYCNLGFYVCKRRCVKVVGNIFDNPELLEAL